MHRVCLSVLVCKTELRARLAAGPVLQTNANAPPAPRRAAAARPQPTAAYELGRAAFELGHELVFLVFMWWLCNALAWTVSHALPFAIKIAQGERHAADLLSELVAAVAGLAALFEFVSSWTFLYLSGLAEVVAYWLRRRRAAALLAPPAAAVNQAAFDHSGWRLSSKPLHHGRSARSLRWLRCSSMCRSGRPWPYGCSHSGSLGGRAATLPRRQRSLRREREPRGSASRSPRPYPPLRRWQRSAGEM